MSQCTGSAERPNNNRNTKLRRRDDDGMPRTTLTRHAALLHDRTIDISPRLPPPPTGGTTPIRTSKGARCRAALLLLCFRAYCEYVLLAAVLEGQGVATPNRTELTSMADD